MKPDLTVEEIDRWLRRVKAARPEIRSPQRWLAEQVHVSYGHIRNVLSGMNNSRLVPRLAYQIRDVMERWEAESGGLS